jgi:peptidoglycan/LPS O-acetylase OafA/YrhL
VVLGFVALRRPRPESNRVLGLVAVAAVGLVGVRMALYPTEAVTGLFAAWPLALLGVLLLRRRDRDQGDRDRQRSGVGLLLAVVAGFMAAVVLTQYPEGGGAEWGGRFFSPIVVALAVLAVTGFRHRLADLPPLDRRWAAGCLSVVAVATAVLGLVTVGQGRARHERFIAAVTRHPAEVTVTTVQALPRIAWRTDQELTWMVTDGSGLAPLLDRLDARGLERMAVVTDHGAPSSTWPDGWKATEVDEPSLRGAGLGLFLLER